MAISRLLTNSQGIVDDAKSWKLYDAWGDVTKYIGSCGAPTDDTTGDPTQFTMTVTEAGAGNSTVANSTTKGELFLATTAANEYDGINLQLKGEQFDITGGGQLYFGARLKIDDATQSDLFIGLAETDTTLMATGTAHAIALGGDGLFFSKLDGATTINSNIYLAGVSSSSAAVTTAMDTSFHNYEIVYDGQFASFYFDGDLVNTVELTATQLDGDITPSFNFRAGSAAARTCNIAWIRAIQIHS